MPTIRKCSRSFLFGFLLTANLSCLIGVLADFTDGRFIYKGPTFVISPGIQLVAAKQRCESWCWAACAETVTRSQGFWVPQEVMVSRLYQKLECKPAFIHDVARVMNAIYQTREGGFARVRAYGTYGPPDNAFGMLAYLQSGKPFIMQVGSHDMVFYGAEVYQVYDIYNPINPYVGPYVSTLFYQDPWPFSATYNELPINIITLGNILGYITVQTESLIGAKFMEQPRSQTVEYGKNLTLRAIAEGTPPLRYQWFRNSQMIAGSRSTLTITRVKEDATGGYYCEVSNEFSTDRSLTATVQVVEVPPQILKQPASRSAKQGRSVTFSVQVSSHLPFSLQWLFNEQAIPGATKASLVLRNLSVGNAGTYQVVASNEAGATKSQSVTLTVIP